MNTNTARIIGQVLENSWGRESSPTGTYSVKYNLAGNLLTLKYTTIVYFASERSLQPQVAEANRQAVSLVNEKLSEVKKAYKSVTDEPLKTSDLGGSDNIELVQPQGPRKVAYYRYDHAFELED